MLQNLNINIYKNTPRALNNNKIVLNKNFEGSLLNTAKKNELREANWKIEKFSPEFNSTKIQPENHNGNRDEPSEPISYLPSKDLYEDTVIRQLEFARDRGEFEVLRDDAELIREKKKNAMNESNSSTQEDNSDHDGSGIEFASTSDSIESGCFQWSNGGYCEHIEDRMGKGLTPLQMTPIKCDRGNYSHCAF